MFEVIPLTEEDAPLIESWYKARGQHCPPLATFSATSAMVLDKNRTPVCAIGTLITEGNEVAWVVWSVTNPDYAIIPRAKALKSLFKGFMKLASKRKCKLLWGNTESTSIGRLYKKLGFEEAHEKHNFMNYIKAV